MSTIDDLLGILALARADLANVDALPCFDTRLSEALQSRLSNIPPQWIEIGENRPCGMWFFVAALAESSGRSDDAWDLLWEVHTLLDRERQRYLANGDSERADTADACATFALVRLARVARTAGRMDTAAEYYHDALRIAVRASHRLFRVDVLPTACLGLCVLYIERGNYPKAHYYARRALRADPVPPLRAQALLMLALIARKQHKPLVALGHLWNAYDLAGDDPVRRCETLASLGEIAGEMGEMLASQEARLVALSLTAMPRMVAPLLAGMLDLYRAALAGPEGLLEQLWIRLRRSRFAQEHQLAAGPEPAPERLVAVAASYLRTFADDIASGIAPYDLVVLLLSLAQLEHAIGRIHDAQTRLEQALRIAEGAGFHERTYQIETLRQSMSPMSSSQSLIKADVPVKPRRSADTALVRFFTLESSDDLVSAGR